MPVPLLDPRIFRYARQKRVALANNAAHQFAASHAMCIYNASAIYSFIPKNACSTLRFSVAAANGCVVGDDDVNWIHSNNQTFRPSLAELVAARYSFVVLRDPFRRIASCFLDKIVDKRPEGWQYIELIDYSSSLETLTFRSFALSLRKILRANIHWRPQVDFLVYQEYDDWFCVEDFAAATETLRDKIGFTVKDTRHLLRHGTGGYRVVNSADRLADTPSHRFAEMKRSGELPAVADLFDDEIVELVRGLYADDFAIYADKIGRPVLFA